MRALRIAWLVALVAMAVVLAAWLPWEAQADAMGTTYTMGLANAPVWSPPPSPSRERFADAFGERAAQDVFETEAPGALRVVVATQEVLLYAGLTLGAIGLFFGLIYRSARGRHLDPALHIALGIGLAVVGALAFSLALWLAFGGWGPPFVMELAVLGPLLGAAGGLWRWHLLRRRALP